MPLSPYEVWWEHNEIDLLDVFGYLIRDCFMAAVTSFVVIIAPYSIVLRIFLWMKDGFKDEK